MSKTHSYKFNNKLRHLFWSLEHGVAATSAYIEKVWLAGDHIVALISDGEYYYYIIGVSLGKEDTEKSNQDVYPGWRNSKGEIVSGQTMQKVKWLSKQIFMIHKNEIPDTSNGKKGSVGNILPTESSEYLWNTGIVQI
jgi:hypothetical protein